MAAAVAVRAVITLTYKQAVQAVAVRAVA